MAHLTLNNKILNDFDKLGIAFSGGLDSSVLLNLISDQVIPKDRITALHTVSYTHLTLPTILRV